jgi:hypothetical protein
MLGAWWAAGPYDLARQVSKGTTGPADFTDAVEFLAAVEGDLDALAFVTSGARAEHNAPRIVRCPLPAGVLRLDTPSGVTFLPELPPNPLDANGRFDGPHVPDDGPTSAELSALVHDAAAFLGCHHAPDAAVTSARLLVLQAMNEGEGEAGGPALAMLGTALARHTTSKAASSASGKVNGSTPKRSRPTSHSAISTACRIHEKPFASRLWLVSAENIKCATHAVLNGWLLSGHSAYQRTGVAHRSKVSKPSGGFTNCATRKGNPTKPVGFLFWLRCGHLAHFANLVSKNLGVIRIACGIRLNQALFEFCNCCHYWYFFKRSSTEFD